MALSATANAELKVATVDVQKLFADYYKTHEAQAEVDKAAQTVQETNNTRAETIKKMEADFNDMVKRFEPVRCDAWHLHFLAGDVRELLAYKREILSLPWILTQHGKRGDGRLVKLPASRFCRLLGAFVGDEAFS